MDAFVKNLCGYTMQELLVLVRDPYKLITADTGVLVVLGVMAAVVLFGFVLYILGSWALHKLARDRRVRGGWLAWLPVLNVWTMGSLSDQYHYVAKGRIRSRRKRMLWLSLAMCFSVALAGVSNLAANGGIKGLFLTAEQAELLVIVRQVLWAVAALFALLLQIHWLIALFDVYASCEPDRAAAYLVVGMLLPMCVPFFLFCCRKKEYGMPPRKPVAPIPVTWQPPASVAEE